MEDFIYVFAFILLLLISILLYLLPSIIAFARRHHYRWIIFFINVFACIGGVSWIVAMVWAVWPSDTGVLDPVVNDPTTNSKKSNKVIYNRYGENCATFIEASNPKSEEAAKETESGANKEVMSFCPRCGKKNEDCSSYCRNCGSKLC